MRGEEGQSQCRKQHGLSQGRAREMRLGKGQACTPRRDSNCRRDKQTDHRSGNHGISQTRLLINLIGFYFNLYMEKNVDMENSSFRLGRGL